MVEVLNCREIGRYIELSRCAAVDMHFLSATAIRLDIDQHRRKSSGNADGRNYDIAHKLYCLFVAAACNHADVPGDRSAGIEIGRDDKQTSSARMLGGDRFQQINRYALCDQVMQRPGVEQTLTLAPDLENVSCIDGGIENRAICRQSLVPETRKARSAPRWIHQ